MLILSAVFCAGYAAVSNDVAAQDVSTHESADDAALAVSDGACSIVGFRTVAQATTPAYLPGETTRRSELGAQLEFPIAALGYDPATQRFTVALGVPRGAEAEHEIDAELIELRRKHVVFEGNSCPGQTESGGSVRCFETTTLASRGSNPVYCQQDKNDAPK